MKIYPTKDIRNVGIVGHGGTGKTQLVSSLLFTAGATPALWAKLRKELPPQTGTKKKLLEKYQFKLAWPMRNGRAHCVRETLSKSICWIYLGIPHLSPKQKPR